MTQKEELVNWLNDAHAMENTNIKILKEHIEDAEDFPELQARLHQHYKETEQHAERIKNCIEAIGGRVSRGKVSLGTLLGNLKGFSSSMYKDDIVKDVLSESASEHFEVACYRSLIVAAEKLGEPRVVEACQRNMKEDEAMAQWVDDQVPEVTRRFMTTKLTLA